MMWTKDTDVMAYVFDFDGTLMDSMPYWAEAMLSVIKSYGVPYPDNLISVITPMGLRGTASYFISLGAKKTVDGILKDICDALVPFYENTIPAKPFVAKTLERLKARGKGLHVLTASPHAFLDPCLKRTGRYKYLDCVWSCEDFPTVKTDPAIYRMAAERLGLPIEKIVFLDDNINAVTAAKQSGILTVGVYDPTSASQKDLFLKVCHGYVTGFDEL
ncbi:MAG: HAD family phosphatase [Clostridia bacterium]|nr:HAD family phosphatase [Clostridia bacterium]